MYIRIIHTVSENYDTSLNGQSKGKGSIMNVEDKEKLISRLEGLAKLLLKEDRELFAQDVYDAINIIKDEEDKE